MAELTREQFLRTLLGTGATAAISSLASAAQAPSKMKLGITLYSYTGEYAPTTVLDGCIADAAALGAQGIELISETHVPKYPNPSEQWVNHWHGLMRRHKIQPSCYDCHDNSRFRKGDPTPKQLQAFLLRDMTLAQRLGFKVVRPAWGTANSGQISAWRELAQNALPFAEKYDIKLAPEIDWSAAWDPRVLDAYVDLIVKTRTKHLGLLLNVGALESCSGGAALSDPRRQSEATADRSKRLQPMLPYIVHLRGKFSGPCIFNPNGNLWELTDEAQQYADSYSAVVPLLQEHGYSGYFSSEYEGPRYAQLASNYLAMQQAKLKRLLERI